MNARFAGCGKSVGRKGREEEKERTQRRAFPASEKFAPGSIRFLPGFPLRPLRPFASFASTAFAGDPGAPTP